MLKSPIYARQTQVFYSLLVCYVGLIFLSIILVFGLIFFYHVVPHQPVVPVPLIYQAGDLPKPCENFVFMASSAIMFVIVSLLARYLSLEPLQMLKKRSVALWMSMLMLALAMLAVYSFHAPDFVIAIMNHHGYAFFLGSLILLAFLWRFRFFKGSKRLKIISVCVFLSLFILVHFCFRVLNIDTTPIWGAADLDVPFYPISQVLAGKILFVDFPEMYGAYAVILSPLLKLFAVHSLLGVTLIFAGLMFVAFCAIFYVLYKEVRYTSVFLLTGLTVVFIYTNAHGWAVRGYLDPYYEYNPIRFFWPCLSLLCFYFYSKAPSFKKGFLFSLLSGVAMIWNLDSGVPIAGAYLIFLCLQIMYGQGRWGILCLKVILHVAIIVACFACFACFFGITFLVSGGPIHYAWLFKYQKIYYLMGFYMLPLPLSLHPWMIVQAVYLFALLFALFYWRKRSINTHFANMIIYLSVLGLGLFIYYTGRSSIENFINILWPAIFVAALLVDHALRLVDRKLINKIVLLLTIPFWIFILICSINLLSLVPRLLEGTEYFFQHVHHPVNPVIANEMEFIQKNKGQNRECVIFSARQGIYFLESGLASSIQGPGLDEIILQSDRDRFFSSLIHHPVSCLFYDTKANTAKSPFWRIKWLQIHLSDLLPYYSIKAENSYGTMVLLVPIHS